MTKPKNKIEPNGNMSREDTVADLLVVPETRNTPPSNHSSENHETRTPRSEADDASTWPAIRPMLKKAVDDIKTEASRDSKQIPQKNTLVWKDKNGDMFTNLSTEINTEVECSDVLDSFYFDRPDLIIRVLGRLKHDGTDLYEHREFPDLEYCLSYTGKGGVHLLPTEMKSRVINLVNDTGAWIVSSYEDHDVLESARQPYVMPVKVEPEFFPEDSVWPQSFTYSALYLANKQKVTKKKDSPYECVLVCEGNTNDLITLLNLIKSTEVGIVIVKGSGYLADVLSNAVPSTKNKDEKSISFKEVLMKLNELHKSSEVPSVDKSLEDAFLRLCENAVVFDQDLLLPDLGIGKTVLNAILKVKPRRRMKLLKLFIYLDSFDLAKKHIFQSYWKIEECYPVVQLAYVHKRLQFIDYFLRKGLFAEMQKNGFVMNSVITDSRAMHFNEVLHHKNNWSQRFVEHHFLWQDHHIDNSEYYGICDHLFRQCLMSEDFQMSMLFWLRTQDPLGAVLLAYSYLKRTAEREHNHLKKSVLKSFSREYQDLAVTFVNACYEKDPETTLKMITRKMDHYDGHSCIDIAISSSNLDFLEQPPCVTVQKRVWNWGYLWEYYADNANKLDEFDVQSVSQNPKGVNFQLLKKNWKKYLQSLFAPVTMFSLNGMGLLVFIFLYALFLLGRFEQTSFHWLEGCLMADVFVNLLEEIVEVKGCYDKGNVLLYFASGWNIVDILSIFLFFFGAGLRVLSFFISSTFVFDMARTLLCVDFIVFTLRLLHNCYSNQVLGPTCSMIFKTVSVLMKFLYILAIIWISYAVASESILYPNTVLNSYTIFYLLRKAYWQMFGQLFLDEMDAGKTTDNNSLDCTNDKNKYATYLELRCPTSLGRYVGPVLMAVYMMFVNILLFNLITASFTKSIKKIQVKAGKLWRFQFFELTRDFSKIWFLPLPFTPVSLLARWLDESRNDEDGFSIYQESVGKKDSQKQIAAVIAKLESFLDTKCSSSDLKKKAIRNILLHKKALTPTKIKTIKKTMNDIEKYLIKVHIVDDVMRRSNSSTGMSVMLAQKQDLLTALHEYHKFEEKKENLKKLMLKERKSDKGILKIKELKQECEKLKTSQHLNMCDDAWDKLCDGLLAEIIPFGQENAILQNMMKNIKSLKLNKHKILDDSSKIKLALEDLEKRVEDLKKIQLPGKYDLLNVEEKRAGRLRGFCRRLNDLKALLSRIPDEKYLDQHDNFNLQFEEKLNGLHIAASMMRFVYIRRETVNRINVLSLLLPRESMTREYLETRARIRDLEVYVLENHIEPKMQKKNIMDLGENESEKQSDNDDDDTINSKPQAKGGNTLEIRKADDASPSDNKAGKNMASREQNKDDENNSDDIPFIYWVPMYSDSQVTLNSDDSTTFLQEPEELKTITFNNKDRKHNVDRRSYMGRYEIEDGKPLNPLWAESGEGDDNALKRWGPNHYGIPVISRIKHTKNKIVKINDKVELEFLVKKTSFGQRDKFEFPLAAASKVDMIYMRPANSFIFDNAALNSKSLPAPYIPCSPNQDPLTEFLRDKTYYVKKVLKRHDHSLSTMQDLLTTLKFVNRVKNNITRKGASQNSSTKMGPPSAPENSKAETAESERNKSRPPPMSPRSRNPIWKFLRWLFSKTKEPEPLNYLAKSHVRSCQKIKTIHIGVTKSEMSKHKWIEVRVINYHNPNSENQAKLETDPELVWVDSKKYKEIVDITERDLVRIVCGLHDAYTEKRPGSAFVGFLKG